MMFIDQTTISKLTSCRAYTKTRIMLNFDTTLGHLCVCVLVLSLSKFARCSKQLVKGRKQVIASEQPRFMIMRRMQQPEFQYLNIPTCGCPVPKSQNTPLKGKSKESVVFVFISLFYSVRLTHDKAWLKPNYYSILRMSMQKREERGKLCLSSCLSEAHPKTYKQDS